MNEQNFEELDDLFRQAFEHHETAPSDDLWNRIEESLQVREDDELDTMFKRAFQEHEVEPSERVWEGIRRQLPIHLIVRRHLVALSQVAAVLLIGLIGIHLPFNQPAGESQFAQENCCTPAAQQQPTLAAPSVAKEKNTHERPSSAPSAGSSSLVTTALPQPADTLKIQSLLSQPVAMETLGLIGVEVFAQEGTTENQFSVEVSNENAIFLTKNDGEIAQLQQLSPNFVANSVSKTKFGLILPLEARNANPFAMGLLGVSDVSLPSYQHFGAKQSSLHQRIMQYRGGYATLTGGLMISWIQNSALQAAILQSSENTQSRAMTFGNFLGLHAGWKVGSKVSVESGLELAEYGQDYEEYLANGSVQHTNVDVNYLSVPLLIKIRAKDIQTSRNRSASLNLVGGLNYSQLYGKPTIGTATDNASTQLVEIGEAVIPQNLLGVVVGTDYDCYLGSQWGLNVGGRVNVQKSIDQTDALHTGFYLQLGLTRRLAE